MINKVKKKIFMFCLPLIVVLGLIFLLVMVVAAGGENGNPSTGNEGIASSDLGFPYPSEVSVTLTQGYWTNLSEAWIWWGNENPPYTRHRAIDYSAYEGAPLIAVADGQIVYSDDLGAFGNAVILKATLDGIDYYFLYAHTSIGSNKSVGPIKKGEQLAKEGKTGLSIGSHLHLEISLNWDESSGFLVGSDRINYLTIYKPKEHVQEGGE